jgi:hypothetical protein
MKESKPKPATKAPDAKDLHLLMGSPTGEKSRRNPHPTGLCPGVFVPWWHLRSIIMTNIREEL